MQIKDTCIYSYITSNNIDLESKVMFGSPC
jgi:hypothetical protein